MNRPEERPDQPDSGREVAPHAAGRSVTGAERSSLGADVSDGAGGYSRQQPMLCISEATKSFSGVQVLHGVSLCIQPGEIRALLGANGSGKSTLIKILSGFHDGDAPTRIEVAGTVMKHPEWEAHRLGLRFVHQDRALSPHLNAVDNLAINNGYPRTRLGTISWASARSRADSIIRVLGYDFDVTRPVAGLTPVQQTGVAIARAIQGGSADARVLVLDEPTAGMPAAECKTIYAAIHRLAAEGLGVLFVSHNLAEVMEHADSVTVLRDGFCVADTSVAALTRGELVTLILGGQKSDIATTATSARSSTETWSLSVAGLKTPALQGISFRVRRGEVLGVTGGTGSGREEIIPALSGTLPGEGVVEICGRQVPLNRPHALCAAGLGTVPADRKSLGIFPGLTTGSNVTISSLSRVRRKTLLNRRLEREYVSKWLDALQVRPANPNGSITNLSGGNQQRIIIARWMAAGVKVLAVDEPTQGVDVGAREKIYNALRDLAEAAGIVVASSDSEELARVCDRVIVLHDGEIVSELVGSQVVAAQIDRMVLGSVEVAEQK